MNVTFAYRGHSAVADSGGRQVFRLVPNLHRDLVWFDAPLLKPLRFREAMSALHDVVINDLRFTPRDKTAYEEWKKQERDRLGMVRRESYRAAVVDINAQRAVPLPPDFQKTFERLRRKYWDARIEYSNYLLKNDPALWRQLMPCDPVITVADDVVFFECFSADESSYGCVSVNREEVFGKSDAVQLGTTNVDYSWDLYHHLQSLRTYRQTRFSVDPGGFASTTAGAQDVREEKIELPAGWLRGFMTLQSAMTMPLTRISLPREVVYSILAFYKRHKASRSPRAIRFELVPDRPPTVVLEPWEQRIESRGPAYQGTPIEPVRVWGARRLLVLGRMLPVAERFDVYLLGTGLPHFWVAEGGDLRLTLGLSGWTTNDWTRGSAIDLLAPPAAPSPDLVNNVAAILHERRAAKFGELQSAVSAEEKLVAEALRQLAHSGQVIHDLSANLYRWRQVMPRALGDAEIGPEHPELIGAREILRKGRAELISRVEAPRSGYVLGGKAGNDPVEILVDADGRIRRGKCVCGYFRKFGVRNGPCRHMLALRFRSSAAALESMHASNWYNQLRRS